VRRVKKGGRGSFPEPGGVRPSTLARLETPREINQGGGERIAIKVSLCQGTWAQEGESGGDQHMYEEAGLLLKEFASEGSISGGDVSRLGGKTKKKFDEPHPWRIGVGLRSSLINHIQNNKTF